MRKEVPLAITLIVGVIVVLSTATSGPIPGLGVSFNDIFQQHISPWMVIVSAFALGLATVNLFIVHAARVRGRRQNWGYSLIMLVTILVFGGVKCFAEIFPSNATAVTTYAQMYNYILSPLMGGQWAFLGFYVASAAYRTFRVRNVDASILLISAVLVMLGSAPVGEVIWGKFPAIRDWLMNVPNMTGQRGIVIGSAIGMFTTGLRVLLGFERTYMGGDSA